MTDLALRNAFVLTDRGFKEGQTVVLRDGQIDAVVADKDFAATAIEQRDVQGALLLPGFIDIQVNGGGGVMFNDEPSIDGIKAIADAHRTFGTTGFLPTLISDDLDKVATAIAAVDQAINENVPGVLGIHLEGPFLNAEKKGVHDPARFRTLDQEAIELFTSLRRGKTLVTLAPEKTTPDMIRQLVAAGVVVAAGHTNASYEETRTGLEAGVSGFTHLFNAMSPLASRAPGVVGAALDDQDSWCGLIADGYHVHPAALRVAIASKPRGRCLLVTDAMSSVGADDKSFELDGREITVADGRCVTADGTLAGSDLDMSTAVKNAVAKLRLDAAEAVRMASRYPAEAIGLGDTLGRIKAGYRANLVLANSQFNVIDTWIDGRPTS